MPALMVDAARYRAELAPVAERIGRSTTTSGALDLASTFLGDRESLFGTDVLQPYREEVASLWAGFPDRARSLDRYQHMLVVLLGQVIDATWYRGFPRYETDADVERDGSLVAFTRSRADFQVGFDYVQYHGHLAMRIPNSGRLRYRRATNHPGRYTQGLTTTRCPRAMAALLNHIAEAFTRDLRRPRQPRPPRIMVNSVLRTIAFQQALASWGYVAPTGSAHLTGHAADIEKTWYERHDQRACRSLEHIVSDLVSRDVIHAVDEQTHWHICLNPAQIGTFESEYPRWTTERR